MANQTVRIKGLRELDKALGELPKATGKNVLRRVGRKNLEPFLLNAASRAPIDTMTLVESMGVSSKLSRRQRRLHRKATGKLTVELFAGAGSVPQAHLQEFGTVNQPPQPFMRPAWDSHKQDVLTGIRKDLWIEIKKSADRLARKRARQAAAAAKAG